MLILNHKRYNNRNPAGHQYKEEQTTRAMKPRDAIPSGQRGKVSISPSHTAPFNPNPKETSLLWNIASKHPNFEHPGIVAESLGSEGVKYRGFLDWADCGTIGKRKNSMGLWARVLSNRLESQTDCSPESDNNQLCQLSEGKGAETLVNKGDGAENRLPGAGGPGFGFGRD